jgi:NTE family protein
MPTMVHVGSESDRHKIRPSLALCLSGGGYRGMLFCLGTLWRLNELGWLPRIAAISSVSGASIAAGALAAAWDTLQFDGAGVAPSLVDRVVEPVRRLARASVDSWALAGGVLSSTPVGEIVADAYAECLFGGMTLQDLPDDEDGRAPVFFFTALNLHSGERVELSRRCMVDRRMGRIDRPAIRLALTIAGCSAFAPLMPPVLVPIEEASLTAPVESDLRERRRPLTLALTDASVCDGLALSAVWQRHGMLLVSDGGGDIGDLAPDAESCHDWFSSAERLVDVVSTRSRCLCRQQLDEALRHASNDRTEWRDGAYWSLSGDQHSVVSTAENSVLATGPVRLEAFPEEHQEQLINCGYAACDVALQGAPNERARPVARLPYPPGPANRLSA